MLEASAGTGKTYTIAALAARYVAGGLPLDRLLLVTFTRMATGELRERVRERLVSVERGLGRALAGAASSEGDPIVALLAEGADDEIEVRRRRLRTRSPSSTRRRSRPPTASARRSSAGSGSPPTSTPDTEFVEDLSDLVADVVDDLYVRRFRSGDSPPLTRAQAGQIARIAIANPAARIAADHGRGPGDVRAARRSGPQGGRGAQAAAVGDDLRRPAHPARRRAGRRRAARRRAPAGPLRGRAGRRVPGHRPGAVGDPAPRVRRDRAHAGADRATPSRRSTRSAAPTSTPTWRRRRGRRARRRSTSTGAATRV